MTSIRRAHPIRVALVICAVAAFPGLFLCAPAANAGVLEQVTGPVKEVVSPVVGAAPTVQQVGATVTTTAQEVTARSAPSATKAADAVTSPAAGAAGASTRSAEDAVHAAKEGTENAAGATLPTPPVPSTTVDRAGTTAGAPDLEAPASSSAAPIDLPPPAPRTTYVPPPGNDGSTGAPLPRWIAYVWPAVALTGPSLANFGESWGRAIVRLAIGAAAGNPAARGVAGVHASGGRPEASSVPLFSRLPSDVARAFSSVPTPVFIYLGLLLLAVIAVALAVRREIAVGRRQ